jgi:hypothetical protein
MVLSRVARVFFAVTLCVCLGAHWAVLHSVAWGAMIVQYSQHVSLVEAVTQTFDGDHPCQLCKQIKTVEHSQRTKDTLVLKIKPDLICTARVVKLRPSCVPFCFDKLLVSAVERAHSPPTPPPRFALV